MLEVLSDFSGFIDKSPLLLQIVILLLLLAICAFSIWFVWPWLRLSRHLKALIRNVRALQDSHTANFSAINIADKSLGHLRDQYAHTLHTPSGGVDSSSGVTISRPKATVPAEIVFNSQTVFEGRLRTEFFKHLPGLLTGLGIIGTFIGLIDGLATASSKNSLDTSLLIGAVEHAFYVSAFAIFLAMLVTLVEKFMVASAHGAVDQLCREIDSLYASGVGEDYLERLVIASEESSSQSRILKDALVGELSEILEKLSQQQIAAATQHHTELANRMSGAIEQGISRPLGEIARGFGQMQADQGQNVAQGLQDAMAAFAHKLDQMLGGQIGQAKDLQMQTLKALESTVAAFQSMAREVGDAGENATKSMSAQMTKALDEMATRQMEIGDNLRGLVDELRKSVSNTQHSTSDHVGKLLGELGGEVSALVDRLESQSAAIGANHQQHLSELSSHTTATIEGLSDTVRAQTAAIDQTTTAMREAISDLGTATNRNVTLMGEGATEMRQAAERFAAGGMALSDVLEGAKSVSVDLAQLSSLLTASSQDIRVVISDYRTARETFADIVEGFRGSVEIAKREVAMTSELVQRLEAAAQKLVRAQTEADEYLDKLNSIFVEAHTSFSDQMLETVRKTNTDFHTHLEKSTSLLASTIAELDETLGDLPTPRAVRS